MKTIPRALSVSLLSLGLIVPTALADPPPGKGKGQGQQQSSAAKSGKEHGKQTADTLSWVNAGISTSDARRIARDLSLTGAKPLPPGTRKNLARGKPLPPGIAKTRLPGSFISQLPQHRGYQWQMAGSDLVLVSEAGQVIADVLSDVFR